MDSWFDRRIVPPTRLELHYGGRMVRCFAGRPRSVHEMLESAVAARPDGVALIVGDAQITYAQLDRKVAVAAGGLRALGVGKGDRVAMVVANSAEFVVLRYAIARLGAISVPLNIRHQLAENRDIVEDCAAKVVVCEAALADKVPSPQSVAELKHVALIHRDGAIDSLAELSRAPPLTEATPIEEEDVATILYTSGTTGSPKGAMLTQLGVVHSVLHYAWVMSLTERDRGLATVPMSHVTGLIALVDTMIHCRGALIVMSAFNAFEFIETASRRRMSFTVIVPAMFNLCLLAPNLDGADLSAWRIAGYGGAIMPEATLERIAEKLPQLQLVNCYGATETTSPAVFMPPEEAVARKNDVGLTVPCGHIVVMDMDGVEAPAGAPGEVYIGGPMVTPGYFNNPEATEREFKAGYWKSGDLGVMDAHGYLRIVDRMKDVINRGGYKVYASEVENALLEHPDVIEVAVVAKPCPILGERVHAFLVARRELDDAELRLHCRDRLSDYKTPEVFHRFAVTLPRNANGKVLRRELRDRLMAL
jgi:O-succinylbenzoic acid--CoA ligase